MICPNINIKEVKDGFNEIVVALGGKPLTDEEFRSSELRNQRQGVDFAAMEATYKVYHRNNGNMLDLAPNGEHSVLFESLLDYYNGDRAKAIAAKSKVYSDEFFNWFGDWTVAESEDIPYQLISHLRRSNINVYGKYRMQQYLRKYSDKLVQLFIGKKKRELFKKQLIKARPDLDSTFILNGISFIHEPFHNQHIVEPYNPALHHNTLLGKRITTDFENRDFFITTFTNVALPDDIQQMIKDGLLKKSSRQEGYYDLTEKGIKQANISQDVFAIFDLIEKGLAEYKSGDVYLTDKGKSEGQAQYKEIDSILDFLHSLEDDKENSVYISTAIRWIVNRSITLPQDHEKAYQAFALARKKHLDLQKYNTLGELIAAPEMQPKEKKKKPFDPDKAKTFSNKRTVTTTGGRVFTVYDVENTEEGQREVCKALAAHYEMSPWCLSTFTSTGEPTESAKRYWGYYNAIPRKIAYENGKPVAFSSDRALSRNLKIFRGREVYYSRLSGGYVIDNLTLADGQPLIDEGVVKFTKDLDFILTAKGEEELKSPDDNREAWWDMEDRHPQETLSDSIVSEQKSMLRGDMDLLDGPEPFEPDPLDLYQMDVHNAIRGIVNEYILNFLRDQHLVPDGLNEIWVSNILTDRYIFNNGDINDAIQQSVNNIHNNTSNEIAQGILGQLNIFDNIRNTIHDELQHLPMPAPQAPGLVQPPAPVAPFYNEPRPGDDDYLLPFFMTPNGEVYGFVTPNNDIYLDEEIISPQHPIHEYTHIWDRIVAKKNPELWKRGVELMKQTSIWDEILNDDNYGKKWSADESISKSQLEFLVASEVHSRLVGENGEQIIDNISKEKGSKDIVNKLRQWLLDFWKSLKSTFSNFSDEELQKLTLEDFNMMTVRDFVELNDENNASKVVDKNGEPLVVYHGSYFKDDATKKGDWSKNALPYATYLAPRKYARFPYYYAAFLNIKNPLYEYTDLSEDAIQEKDIFDEYVADKGYDGIITTNNNEILEVPQNAREIVATNPNQIKSVDNEGTFSKQNDDIRFHVSKNQVLRSIREYIENYIKNKFGTGNSYERIRTKVKELEDQFNVVGVAVSAGKKLNFDQLHFKGDPIQNEKRIARLQGLDVPVQVQMLIQNINRLFPKLNIKSIEDLTLAPGNAYYDKSTNTIHYSPIRNGEYKSVDKQDIVEECLHPLIACIAATDKALFNKLLEQASKDEGLVSYVKQAYKGKSQDIIDQEIVTQAIARMYANNTYDHLLSIDEFQRKEHARRFKGVISAIKAWVNKIKKLVNNDKLQVKNSDFSTVISSLDSLVDVLNTVGIEFTEVDSSQMSGNMQHISEEESPYSTPIFHTTETTQPKKSYVSPTTQRKDITTSEDLMSSSTQTPRERIRFNLEDNSSSNVTSQSERQRDYLDKIADKLLSAFNILARSYERDIQTKSASRQRTKNKVHEIINKLQELRGVQAITEAVEWGLVNMGPSVKVGEYVDTKTITGFLYQKKQDTDGTFTGLSPEQLYDIYRNGIGFYEKTLLPLLPGDTDLNYGRETIQKINDLKASVAQAKELWAQAMQIVGRRIIDGAIQDQDGIPQDVKDDMKQVAYDWLTTNSYYGDISVFQEYTANFGQMENPIIRIAFNLIQRAETATNEAIHPIAAALTKAYRKADFTPKRWFKSNWQKALMEIDKDGIPTGNFVRDINYGQYEKDLADFVETLISDWEDDFGYHYIRDEYGYIVRSDTGERVEEQEWVGDKMPNWYLYQLEIERWKADHANKMYTFDYYKERMSKPYRGFEDPALISSTSKLDGHGLSPKTLAAYTRIQSNINLYLNACSDEETGMAHPEELDPQDKLKLDEWYDALDNLSNPYNADGTIKDEENRIIAFELRAWQRWIGERTETRIDQQKFDEEVKKVTERSIKENNPRLLEDFYRYNTYTGIHPDYFATTIGRFSEARMEDIDVVQARLIKSSLQNLVKSKNGYTREIGLMENNPQFFLECKRTDQLIADGRAKSSPEFAKEFEQSFYSAMIPYQDEFGNYRTKSGTSITDISGIDHRELMSFWDYLKGKYIDMAKMYGTIPGLVDNNGVPIPITGTDEEIAEKVEELLTYVDTRKNEFGEYIQEVKPLSIFSMIMPSIDVFKHPQTGRLTPTITQIPRGRFAEKSDRTGKYINRDFNKADNHAEQPKRKFYDNSKAMQRLEEDGLKEVYDECIKYMQESYKKHSPSTRRYDYQLPKMNADDAAIASRMFAKGFRKTASDLWHSMNEVQPNDYGMLSENDRIKSPDGTIGTQLPLRYVGKLDDPSTYTTDVVGAVIMYAHMAENYKNKQEIEAQLNTLMYNLDPENRSQDAKDDSKSLNAFRAMMNSGLYDNQWDLGSNYDTKEPSIYKTAAQNIAASTGTFALGGLMGGVSLGIPVAIAGGAATSIFGPMAIGLGVGAVLGLGTGIISQLSGKVASNKFARMFQRTESLQMLGFNILSMSVGFADAVIKMARDSIAGKYMTVRDLATGVGYFVLNFPKVVSNIGNPLANCKLVAMMQMNNVSKDTRRIYNNMNYGRTRKLINNICLGGFSMLDYGANCILLKSYYNNIRFYNGNTSLGIKPGWYSKYELKQAFIDAGGSNLDAEIAYFRCNETLWDAYWYDSENSTTQLKDEYKDPSNKRFVPLKLRNRVRTKTVQRGALYNGMNPDNDIPLYKRSIYGSAVGAMRGWLTQAVQHLMYGLDDTSVREFKETVEQKNTDTRGVQKQNKIKVRKPRTDLQNSRRMTWNYETGLPQDEILHGLRRSFSTLFKKALYAFKGIKDHNAKLSYVEKYAWKDTIVTLGLTAMLMVGWIPVHDWAKSAVKPENREQAGATGPVDAITRYIPQRFIQDGIYKLFLDDLYFRTIESQLSGFDPKTGADIFNALSVYKSAFEEHLGLIQGVGDAFGVTGHDLSEVINRGSYKYYTRGEKLLYKTLSLGQLDNLHTAFSYNGLQQNLNFYYHQYGWIYKAFGYDDFKNETAKKSTSKFGSKDFGKSGFGSKSFGSKKF